MTSVPPPPGPPSPPDPQDAPAQPEPSQHAQFAPPGTYPPAEGAAPQVPHTPQAPPPPPGYGQYAPPAQPWGAPQQWQQWQQPSPGPQGQGGQGQGAQPGHGQYAPPGQPWNPPQQQPQSPADVTWQPGHQLPWGAPQPASPRRSKKPVVLFAVLGAVVVGLAAAAFVIVSSPDVDALPTDVDAVTTAHVQALSVGNCLESAPTGSSVAEVTVVPCADGHAAQVIAAKKFSGESFPGDARVIEQTTAVCPGRSIAADAAPEDLEFLVWTPSSASWDEGDRQGLCIASSPSTPLTGSLTR